MKRRACRVGQTHSKTGWGADTFAQGTFRMGELKFFVKLINSWVAAWMQDPRWLGDLLYMNKIRTHMLKWYLLTLILFSKGSCILSTVSCFVLKWSYISKINIPTSFCRPQIRRFGGTVSITLGLCFHKTLCFSVLQRHHINYPLTLIIIQVLLR